MDSVLRKLGLKKGESTKETDARKRLQKELFSFQKVGNISCISSLHLRPAKILTRQSIVDPLLYHHLLQPGEGAVCLTACL